MCKIDNLYVIYNAYLTWRGYFNYRGLILIQAHVGWNFLLLSNFNGEAVVAWLTNFILHFTRRYLADNIVLQVPLMY